MREDSVIDITGTDIEREMLSMISEHTELPIMSPIWFFESNGSNSEDLLNVNFANVPRNNYSTPVMAVPPIRAERLTRQIPTQPDINLTTYATSPTGIQGNGPFRFIPITPLVIPHEIPQPNDAHPYNGRGILQTPMIGQYKVPPATQFHLPNEATQRWCNTHITQTLNYYNQMSLLMSHIFITPMVSYTWIPKAPIAIWR